MKKILILLCVTTSFMLATADIATLSKEVKTEKSVKKKSNKPFLIRGKIPHLTKTVKNNWDNPLLGLTDIQKQKLLEVRRATISAIKKLKKELFELEEEVVKATISGEAPKNLKVKVDKIAKLKAEATMMHIKCFYDTKNILDAKQFLYLNKK